jgi:1-phosphatidylinositol-4-phosphate 5-kinase
MLLSSVRSTGMHRVKMYHLRRKHHFVIMGSVFDTPMQIHTIFDLKGTVTQYIYNDLFS